MAYKLPDISQFNYNPVSKEPDDPVRVIVTGVPAAGKSGLIRAFADSTPYETEVHITGDVMTELSSGSRDKLREKTLTEQRALLTRAVEQIAQECARPNSAHLIDCHLSTFGSKGVLLGLTPAEFEQYAPDAILYLTADTDEILRRREGDKRHRQRSSNRSELLVQEELNQAILDRIRSTTETPKIPIDILDTTNLEADSSLKVAHLTDLVEYARPVQLGEISRTNLSGDPISRRLSPYIRDGRLSDIERKVGVMAKASRRVRELSREFSQSTRQVVYVVNNETGSIFEYGMGHWSANLTTREDAFEFAQRVKETSHWGKYLKLKAKLGDIGGYRGNLAEMDKAIDRLKAKSLYDLAIIAVAKEYLRERKIDSFVMHTADVSLSSESNEFYYEGHILARLKGIMKHPGLRFVIADTCNLGRASNRYHSFLIQPNVKDPTPTEVHDDGRGRREADEDWMNKSVVYYDPYYGQGNTWWGRIPEVMSYASPVECQTNLGPMTLQDYFRIAVARASGQPDLRKGWEHQVDNMLRVD